MKLKKNTSLDESAKAWLRRRFSSGDAADAERKNDSPV